MKIKTSPIDVVVAWVDGTDPLLYKKRMQYLDPKMEDKLPGADHTRFHSLNEVSFCILSIFKFAPFVRKIFIVTDNQNPGVDQVVKTYFPERLSDLHLVDHKEIFEDYETHLPTFNSICISNMLWRIKGLSKQFVYFNDDIFLLRPITPSTWFKNGNPVLRGKWVFPPYERLVWDRIKEMIGKTFFSNDKERKPSFQVNQWNAARLLGFKIRYFRSGHTPLALNRERLEDYFTTYPNILVENIKHRFRVYSQFNTVALANHLELLGGNKNRSKPQAVYMQPYNRNANYIARKFKQALKEEQNYFLCVQSLELASRKHQDEFFNKMNQLLQIQIT